MARQQRKHARQAKHIRTQMQTEFLGALGGIGGISGLIEGAKGLFGGKKKKAEETASANSDTPTRSNNKKSKGLSIDDLTASLPKGVSITFKKEDGDVPESPTSA
jgi:hypothetical protein